MGALAVARKGSAKEQRLSALEEAIGHSFADRALFRRALTHVSAVRSGEDRTESYQRLEFLGDRVLGLVIAEMLIAAFPAADEGELSRRLAALVRKETCAEVARGWGVGAALLLGEGEVMSGGRRKEAILGDACEALIGAVFLDGGLEAARRVIGKAFSERLSARGAAARRQDDVAGMGAG